MKYEIVNPSDKCFVSGENEEIVTACVLLLCPAYTIVGENGERGKAFFPFGMTQEGLAKVWKEEFGRTFDELVATKPWAEMEKVFSSFEYAGERTSLTNIGKAVARWAKTMKAKTEEEVKP